MAYTSVVGIATSALLGRVEPEVVANWYAAAPIVVLGAPLGAVVVHFIPRSVTLLVVSALCVAQFVWMCLREQVSVLTLTAAIVAIFALQGVFIAMDRFGRARRDRVAGRL